MNGDFANAVTGTFSPLYSLLLGPVLRIVDPGPAHEAAVVHAVNFAIYCAALWAFDRFLAVLRHRAEGTPIAVADWAWFVFGYAVFTWSSLELIGVADMSADLLMAVFVYGAAAVLVRMDGPTNSPANGVRLGIMLGLGYLAKTAMFPLAFVFFVCGLLSGRGWRLNVPALVTAVLVFAVVVSPFVTALSRQKGRVATGDIGWLDYAWFVNGVTMYAHWQGGPAGYGTPVHPSRKIHESPDVFEYATPIAGTHPVFFDPSYWYEGLETRVDVRKQIWALMVAGETYWDLIRESAAEWLALGVLLVWGSRREALTLIMRQWFLIVPALAAGAMFAIVHTEPRFVGAFVVMVMAALLLAVRIPDDVEPRRFATALIIGVTLVVFVRVTISTGRDAVARGGGRSNADYQIAMTLQSEGLRAGDPIGMIGSAYDAYWARLARARFVAEIPQSEMMEFWTQTPDRRASVYDAFRRAGARWIVTEWVPSTPAAAAWRPVGATGLYLYSLDAALATVH
jgi:hypothetical protein